MERQMQTTLTRSQPLANKAPRFPGPKPTPRIGMDMVPPYVVYIDGNCVAEYGSEEEANKHFNQLCGRISPAQAHPAAAASHWEVTCYRPTRTGFTVESTAPDGVVWVESIAHFVEELPRRDWGANLAEAQHLVVLHEHLCAERAQRDAAGAPQDATPFPLGAWVTDRDGKPTALARSFRAPFFVVADGVVVADYGDDEQSAEAHYAGLVEAHRKAQGIADSRMVMA